MWPYLHCRLKQVESVTLKTRRGKFLLNGDENKCLNLANMTLSQFIIHLLFLMILDFPHMTLQIQDGTHGSLDLSQRTSEIGRESSMLTMNLQQQMYFSHFTLQMTELYSQMTSLMFHNIHKLLKQVKMTLFLTEIQNF